MKRLQLLGVGVAVAAVLVVTACGGPSQEQRGEAQTAREEAKQASAAAEAADIKAENCQTNLDPYLGKLVALDVRMNSAGADLSDYSREATKIKKAYEDVPVLALSDECREMVGVHAEKAGMHFVVAKRLWSYCAGDPTCEMDEAETYMMKSWRKANRQIELAKEGMETLVIAGEAAQEEAEKLSAEADKLEAEL